MCRVIAAEAYRRAPVHRASGRGGILYRGPSRAGAPAPRSANGPRASHRARSAASRRPRQIVAMGGGGFSEEPDSTALDDYVLDACGRGAAAGAASCRPPAATTRATSSSSTGRSAGGHCDARRTWRSSTARWTTSRAAAAGPGRDLRRRRQHGEPARRVAGPRHRPDPARGVGARRGARRPLRRLDVLVRGRRHRRRSARGSCRCGTASACCRARNCPHYRTAPGRVHGGAARRARAGPAPPTTAWRCTSSTAAWRRSSPRARAGAPTGWGSPATGWSRRRCGPIVLDRHAGRRHRTPPWRP